MFQQNYKNKYLKYKSKYLDLKYGGVFDLNQLSIDEQDYYDKLTTSDKSIYGPRFIKKNELKQELIKKTDNLKKILIKNLKEIKTDDKIKDIEKKLLKDVGNDSYNIEDIKKKLLKIEIEDEFFKKNKEENNRYYLTKEDDQLVDIEIDRQIMVSLHQHGDREIYQSFDAGIIKKIEKKIKKQMIEIILNNMSSEILNKIPKYMKDILIEKELNKQEDINISNNISSEIFEILEIINPNLKNKLIDEYKKNNSDEYEKDNDNFIIQKAQKRIKKIIDLQSEIGRINNDGGKNEFQVNEIINDFKKIIPIEERINEWIKNNENENEKQIKIKAEEIEKKNIIKNKKKDVMEFFKRLFQFLFYHNQCFFEGTLVFEDKNNKLYNFLTYGIISDNNSCLEDPKIAEETYSVQNYMDVYKKYPKVESSDKCFVQGLEQSLRGCKSNKCLILEIIFDEDLNYLCDQQDKESKKSCIYYKFKYENKQYIFLKLLPYTFNSRILKGVTGVFNYFKNKENNEYDPSKRYKKRDNVISNYEFNEEDDIFYKNVNFDNNPDSFKHKYLKDDQENIYNVFFKHNNDDDINYYNTHLRTGNEMFITDKLKNYFIFISESRTYEEIQKYVKEEDPNSFSNINIERKEKSVSDSNTDSPEFTTEESPEEKINTEEKLNSGESSSSNGKRGKREKRGKRGKIDK